MSAKISIIVPVYNGENYLSQCLDSIICQTFEDFECILVDDGSTDNSSAICDEYANKDSRFKVIHKKNEGVSSARNIGIKESKADFLAFVDADDWLNEKYCEIIIENIQNNDLLFFQARHQYFDGVTTVALPFNKAVVSEPMQKESIIFTLLYNQAGYEFFGYTWNKVFKKQILIDNEIYFMKNLEIREDELFTLQFLSKSGGIKVIPDVIYNYRIVSTGLTNKRKSSFGYYLLATEMQKELNNFYSEKLKVLLKKKILLYYTEASILGKGFIRSISMYKEAYQYYRENLQTENLDREKLVFLYKKSIFFGVCIFIFLKIRIK